jgi:glycogen synthase
MFDPDLAGLVGAEIEALRAALGPARVHLVEDRRFYVRTELSPAGRADAGALALALQRDVIQDVLPRVRPDLIHCTDWMTGLIPAAAQRQGVPALFTLHRPYGLQLTLAEIEAAGLAAADFWQNLYFARMPAGYEETRATNPVDLLASGVFAADYVNALSPTFLAEMADGVHDVVPPALRSELARKRALGRAGAVLHPPEPALDPARDERLAARYTAAQCAPGKRENKRRLQEALGLETRPEAALFFWPCRLDPGRCGCELLADALPDAVAAHADPGLQLAVIADGLYQKPLRDIVRHRGLEQAAAVRDREESLWHLALAGADFALLPSRFVPTGRMAVAACRYGTLPVALGAGAARDTLTHLDASLGRGNAFLFETYDAGGLRWAMDQAMAFQRLAPAARERQIRRVMRVSAAALSLAATAREYAQLYRRMLSGRPRAPA